jgi:hypothetical protein
MKDSAAIDRKAIETIERKHHIDWRAVSISRTIRECPKCHSVLSYLRTKIKYGESQTFESSCPCPKCQTPGIEWTTPCEELYCNNCGKNGFELIALRILD